MQNVKSEKTKICTRYKDKSGIRPKWDKTKLVSHFGGGSYVKGEKEEEEEKNKRKPRKVWILVWIYYGFV